MLPRRDTNSSVGFAAARECVPYKQKKTRTGLRTVDHRVAGIPDDFCERNGGVILLRGTRAQEFLAEWAIEFDKGEAEDGHDQVSLRRILFKHRNETLLYELPAKYNCRTVNSAVTKSCLVLHKHRPKHLSTSTTFGKRNVRRRKSGALPVRV